MGLLKPKKKWKKHTMGVLLLMIYLDVSFVEMNMEQVLILPKDDMQYRINMNKKCKNCLNAVKYNRKSGKMMVSTCPHCINKLREEYNGQNIKLCS